MKLPTQTRRAGPVKKEAAGTRGSASASGPRKSAGAAPAPTQARNLESRVAYRFSLLSNLNSRVLAEMYKSRFGLTLADWKTLAIVGHFEPVFSGAIAERTSMGPEQVSRALERLAAKGVIERSLDEQDRRRVAVTLGRKGREAFEEIEAVRAAMEEDLLDALSADERARLFRILDKLDERARARLASRDAWKGYLKRSGGTAAAAKAQAASSELTRRT